MKYMGMEKMVFEDEIFIGVILQYKERMFFVIYSLEIMDLLEL